MKRYAKFGYAVPFRFRVILEKPQGGQNDPPPPTRAKVKQRQQSLTRAGTGDTGRKTRQAEK